MISRKLVIPLMFCIASILAIGMATAAAANPDILIHPDVATINVNVAPNAVSPPLEIEYTNWGLGVSAYAISVSRISDGFTPPGCDAVTNSGTIPNNDFKVKLLTCKIPNTDVGKPYTVLAGAKCKSCAEFSRSRTLVADANINPVPELSTGMLTAAGLLGLLGLVRYRKK